MIELNFPNPVREGKDFYGRRAELDRIEQVFRSGTRRPVAVYGERRMGKTSLMNVVTARLQAQPDARIVPLFPVPVAIYSLQDFAKEALQSLCGWRGTSLTGRGLLGQDGRFHLASVGQFFGETRALLRDSPAALHLLCIDEFDALLHDCSNYGQLVEAVKILDLCHELVTQTDLPLTFFFSLTRLPESVRDASHTLVTEEAERVDLLPLSAPEMDELLDGIFGPQLTFDAAQRRQLERLSGGHPYLLKLLLANWLDHASTDSRPLALTASSLEQAADHAARDPRAEHVLDNVLRIHFDHRERDLVTLMAGLDDRITPAQLERLDSTWRTVAERLVRRGYLARLAGDGTYTFLAAFWGRWLRQRPAFEEHLDRLADLHGQVTGQVPPSAAQPALQPEPRLRDTEAGPTTASEIEIDAPRRRVLLRGQEIRLTPQEYQILSFLCERAEGAVPRNDLIQHLWPQAAGDVNEAALDAAISRLRRKLEDDARRPRYLETVVGYGFILHRAAFARGKSAAGTPAPGRLADQEQKEES